MIYVAGQIYQNGEFIQGYMGIEDGIIKDFGEGETKKADFRGIIVPTFVNSHTHIADSVVSEEIKGGIEDVVAPPNGLKHRILRATSSEVLIESMRQVTQNMLFAGISHFADFREGGVSGVDMLSSALSKSPISSKIFGRPKDMKYDENEMESLLESVDGIGLSAISDYNIDDITQIANHTKSKNKMLALHASERVREDIDAILDLKPDFLIHMNKATKDDLKLCAQSDVPIVLCPRSEVFFGHVPNITLMQNCGVTLTLGSDNAMLNSPCSLLREMEFAYKIARLSGGIGAKDILNMVLVNSRKVLNLSDDIRFDLGKRANVVLFDLAKKDPAYALVNGAHSRDISLISLNDFIWMKQ
jgi:cytosine/adenosine deaminase-related metal-dependent hydrolase